MGVLPVRSLPFASVGCPALSRISEPWKRSPKGAPTSRIQVFAAPGSAVHSAGRREHQRMECLVETLSLTTWLPEFSKSSAAVSFVLREFKTAICEERCFTVTSTRSRSLGFCFCKSTCRKVVLTLASSMFERWPT